MMACSSSYNQTAIWNLSPSLYISSPDKQHIMRQICVQSTKRWDKSSRNSKNETGKANMTFEELHIAVLLVYNDINKLLPGHHFDPPSKERIKILMQLKFGEERQESDINLDGELDREEFAKFVLRITHDTFVTVSRGLITTLAIAPTVALLTKGTAENVPGVGKAVQKLPNSVYVSIVTLVIVMFQQRVGKG